MTAPVAAAAPELAAAMAETRRIRAAVSALADAWEAAAVKADTARGGTRGEYSGLLFGDRARMLRDHARQVREAAGTVPQPDVPGPAPVPDGYGVPEALRAAAGRAERAEAVVSEALLRLAGGNRDLHATLLADYGYGPGLGCPGADGGEAP